MTSLVKEYEFDAMSRRPLYAGVTQKLLELCVVAGGTVVDLGCGSGIVTETLFARFGDSISIIGVDPSEHELDIARSRLRAPNVRFLQGRAQRMEALLGCEVDVVIISNVVHQIPRDERGGVFESCFRVLKPGGKIGLNTPYYDGAILPCSRTFYLRWMAETQRWLKDRGSAIASGPAPVALELLTAAQHRDLLQAAGFRDVIVEEVPYEWSADDWKAVSGYSVFAVGATGIRDVALASSALTAGVARTFEALGLTTVPRHWLFVSAVK
jgi:ubiquinone/menaquinone biosynthesis C-methylase UbiE